MNLLNIFKIYLQSEGNSSATIKNYLSDVKNFIGWFNQISGTNNSPDEKLLFKSFTKSCLEKYQNYLLQNKIPPVTINRRFSTLRKLGRFIQTNGWIKNNPALEIKNIHTNEHLSIPAILTEFRHYLERKKVSQITIQNYLSDLRHFLKWLEAN